MKCRQNLCQRNKNLKPNGNCNVCDDAIAKVVKPSNNDKKKLENITVDLKLMVDIHKKLCDGVPVDQQVVSGLLLSGIVNILNQHNVIEVLEEKLESLFIENKTNKIRTESIENWLLKHDENLREINAKLLTTSSNSENVSTPESEKVFKKKCDECDEVFFRNSDFEKHMEEKHKAKKTKKCSICGKMFLLEWRLKKHVDIHEKKTRKCKFFLSKEVCPFDDIGCKFAHSDHEHDDIENIEDDDNDNEQADIESTDDDYSVGENQCHLCRLQLASKDDLMTHVEFSHEDYFEGVLEYAAANRNNPF